MSALWGISTWAVLIRNLPPVAARWLLRAADSLARLRPSLADIVVVSGRPRL